jgi:hypothetical protein
MEQTLSWKLVKKFSTGYGTWRLRPVVFWVIMQRVVVISYRRFWATYQFHHQGSRIKKKACCTNTEFTYSSLYKLCNGANSFLSHSWTLRMGPIGCSKMSIRNCHYSLCNNTEDLISQLLYGGSLKSCIKHEVLLPCLKEPPTGCSP